MNNENQEMKWKKILKIVLNVVFYCLIALLLVFSITNLTRKDNLEVASIFGRGYCTVLSDSMAGDNKDSFTTKDLVLVKKVTDRNRTKLVNKLKVGDIITFVQTINGKKELNTHRIVDILKDSDGKVVSFFTQGDANAKMYGAYDKEVGDISSCENPQVADVRGIYTGKIKGMGSAMKFLQTPNGFLLCVVLPMALFFIVMLLLLVLNFVNIRKAKSEQEHAVEMEELKQRQAQMLEEEKARIRAEILAEQQAAGGAESAEVAEVVEAEEQAEEIAEAQEESQEGELLEEPQKEQE